MHKKKLMMKLVTEGCLPLAQPKGHGQVDFGECLYCDGQGQERKGRALTVSFPQSNKGYTQLYPAQNQECLLTGLQRVFEHIGGVPPRLKFDNLSAAVVKVLEGGEREDRRGQHPAVLLHDHPELLKLKRAGFQVIKTLDDFVWNQGIELPVGLTREYMEGLQFLKPR